MRRGICLAMLGVLLLGALLVTTGGAQVYPVRLDGERLAPAPAAATPPSLVLADGGLQFPDGTIQITAATSGYAPVADTGQKTCYNTEGNPITCTNTGQDGWHQTGVDWPAPRFTLNGPGAGNGTVTDELTGLVWLQDAGCLGTATWQGALDAVGELSSGTSLAVCSSYTPGTFGDWRLPNVKELLSLVDYSQSAPALPLDHPFVNVQLNHYWSSSSSAANTTQAWEVRMAGGFLGPDSKTDSHLIWPVRGGQ